RQAQVLVLADHGAVEGDPAPQVGPLAYPLEAEVVEPSRPPGGVVPAEEPALLPGVIGVGGRDVGSVVLRTDDLQRWRSFSSVALGADVVLAEGGGQLGV